MEFEASALPAAQLSFRPKGDGSQRKQTLEFNVILSTSDAQELGQYIG